jgi:competence protein ComEC
MTPDGSQEMWRVRRPLLGVALAFILGTLIGSHYPPRPASGVALSLCAVTAAFATAWRIPGGAARLWTALRCAVLLVAVAAVAWTAAGLAPSDSFALHGADAEEPLDGRRVTVEGVVAGDPETPVLARGVTWTFPLAVETVSDGARSLDARGTLRVRWRASPGTPEPAYGERWRIEGRLSSRPVRNPEWRVVMSAGHWGSGRLSSGHGNPVKAWCYRARKHAAGILSAGLADRPEQAGVLRALMLGYRSDLDPELHSLFVSTGTLHIFAISGSHIVILAGLVLVLLRAIRVPRLWWGAAIVPILAGFTLATGAEASAVRACLMAVLYWIAPLFGRRPDALSALALSAVLILAVDPGQLMEAGFVFSFAVVLGLILLHPLLARRMRPAWEADPLRLQAEPKPVTWLREGGRYVAGIVSLTIVAWLVSTPITASWFGRFTFAALPANLAIVPLTALAMLSGCLSLLLGQVWTGFAEVFNNASLALVDTMLWILRWLRHMPAGNAEVAPWRAWTAAAWYAVLAGWVYLEYALAERAKQRVKLDRHAAAGNGTMTGNSRAEAEAP